MGLSDYFKRGGAGETLTADALAAIRAGDPPIPSEDPSMAMLMKDKIETAIADLTRMTYGKHPDHESTKTLNRAIELFKELKAQAK